MSRAQRKKKAKSNPEAEPSLPYRPGVGAVLFNGDGRVLVARRNDVAGAWQFPQGGIKKKETPDQAIWRELREEIGTDKAEIIHVVDEWLTYDLPADLVGKAWRGRYRGQAQKWFALRFLGADSDIDLAGDGHPEFDAWQWVDLASVPALIVGFKKPMYEKLAAALRPVAEAVRAGAAAAGQGGGGDR